MPAKEHTNRLINEKSPYLLQHAHNPVDWYPWGDEAFAKAKAEDKTVFLSIGYSACHWCHVMERESFEDEEVAALLNKSFVSIKVDREERPDVDNLYMNACVAMTGQGGWPLSCFLTPDKKPFFAGTYFPKNDRYGSPGFISVLSQIADSWQKSRDELLRAGNAVISHVASDENEAGSLDQDAAHHAFLQFGRSFDEEYGGFGGAPKFPSLQNILFLLRYGLQHDEQKAFQMAGKTLSAMSAGGIYDQIGGGFCRYSTDELWLVPHFEKMMVDQAMHIITYSEASSVLDDGYGRIAREVIGFCVREMSNGLGAFYTALDADSEGVEGKYYLFTPQEVSAMLGADAERFCTLFDITEQGNFEKKGQNIPNLRGGKLSQDDLSFAEGCRQKLLAARSKRVPPARDEKVLASVNGLMTAALATAGRLLGEPEYVDMAEKCADFILNNMLLSGRLQDRWRDGDAAHPATSDDYAYLVWGLLELYEATFEPKWLGLALNWIEKCLNLFWDDQKGGFFLSGKDVTDLPARQKSPHDGAIPSGNSVNALNLVRLSHLCGKTEYAEKADELFSTFAGSVNHYPSAFCGLLCAALFEENGGSEIVIADGSNSGEFISLLRHSPRYMPFTVSAVCGNIGAYSKLSELAPYTKSMKSKNGRAAAYICRNGACRAPIDNPEGFRRQLMEQ